MTQEPSAHLASKYRWRSPVQRRTPERGIPQQAPDSSARRAQETPWPCLARPSDVRKSQMRYCQRRSWLSPVSFSCELRLQPSGEDRMEHQVSCSQGTTLIRDIFAASDPPHPRQPGASALARVPGREVGTLGTPLAQGFGILLLLGRLKSCQLSLPGNLGILAPFPWHSNRDGRDGATKVRFGGSRAGRRSRKATSKRWQLAAAHNGARWREFEGGEAMANRKQRRNRLVILKALCALIVGGCLVLPLGGLVLPYLEIPNLPFSVIEAVVSASVGFGIADLLS